MTMVTSTTEEIDRTGAVTNESIDEVSTGVALG
jgi:hypothetical protein